MWHHIKDHPTTIITTEWIFDNFYVLLSKMSNMCKQIARV